MLSIIRNIKNFFLYIANYKTVGARAIVVNKNQVLLVKHTYMPNWYSIGGAVEKGETPLKAVQRELLEEAGIRCLKPPLLFGVYLNNFEKRDDYVVLYIVSDFEQEVVKSLEISEIKWFDLNDLPQDISAGTMRRIQEYLKIKTIDEKW